jgi:predicted nucleic acid-binding protein
MSLPIVPVVFADANVLYNSALRDILIELALADIIKLHWSSIVLDELSRALVRTRADYDATKALRLITAMTEAVPAALIIPPDETPIIDELPDPDDAHVLVAAQHGECDVLVTFNVRDFPADVTAQLSSPVTITHPDAFLIQLLTTQAAAVLPILETVRENLTRPPLTIPDYAASLERAGLKQTAELLRYLLPS